MLLKLVFLVVISVILNCLVSFFDLVRKVSVVGSCEFFRFCLKVWLFLGL